MTIAALAERAVPELARYWDLSLREASKPQAVARPVRRDLTTPTPPRPTTVAIRERMVGEVVVRGQPFTLEAVAEFSPLAVPALRQLPCTVEQPVVKLVFVDRNSARFEVRCRGEAVLLVREHSVYRDRIRRSFKLAQRKLEQISRSLADAGDPRGGVCDLLTLKKLCSHLGQARQIRYLWTVTASQPGAPVSAGQRLQLTKRLAFVEDGNPWRQLSEGCLELVGDTGAVQGRLCLDLGYFVEQLRPLLRIEAQQDAPDAIGDLAEMALWALRIVLRVHVLNFLPPGDGINKTSERLPGPVGSTLPQIIVVPPVTKPPKNDEPYPTRKLACYTPSRPDADARPVLLIHGYGASGSTFAHRSIPHNLVSTLLDAGREVWVLDLRTSIGLDQRTYWSFEEVATEDIPDAVERALQGHPCGQRIDVVAHCIGAAMFSFAVLDADHLHERIGAVVLSQVGPLLRASPMNRFRGYVASYLQQYIRTEVFDVRPERADPNLVLLVDALLASFPYPDGDGEADRLLQTPGFAAVRHRADGIFGQTMRLANIGDDTLRALDAIYGWVTVRGLAQVSHYAREQLVADASGLNQVVSQKNIGAHFGFPVLLLHGRQNAVFDWRGSLDTYRLLQRIFDPHTPEPPIGDGDVLLGKDTPRRLVVLAKYGHQDMLIGKEVGSDVFAHVLRFLQDHKIAVPAPVKADPPLRVELPWMGPVLGRVGSIEEKPDQLRCRLAVRPPPARASTVAVIYVPAHRNADGWSFDADKMVGQARTTSELKERALEIDLIVSVLPQYDGFAVVTLHNDLPLVRVLDLSTWKPAGADLFASPGLRPPEDIRELVIARLTSKEVDADVAVVRLDPAWIRAALPDANARHALSSLSQVASIRRAWSMPCPRSARASGWSNCWTPRPSTRSRNCCCSSAIRSMSTRPPGCSSPPAWTRWSEPTSRASGSMPGARRRARCRPTRCSTIARWGTPGSQAR